MAEPARAAHEVVLDYAEGAWRARGDGIELADPDLAALDRLIVAALGARGNAARVHVRFDTSRLPAWLRQYHAHYFNYVLRIDRPRAAASMAP